MADITLGYSTFPHWVKKDPQKPSQHERLRQRLRELLALEGDLKSVSVPMLDIWGN